MKKRVDARSQSSAEGAKTSAPSAHLRAFALKINSPQRYRMIVAYDGAAYAGWQVQPGAVTIQGTLEAALRQVTGAATRVQCSGRTDAGVHAIGQVAHFDLAQPYALDKLQLSLNAVLPEDIRVLGLKRARADFHARFSPKGKEYRYFIWNNPVMPPHLRHHHYLVRKPLDTAAMRRAAKLLVGKQDFAAFSANPNREISGTVRHLHSLTITRRSHAVVIRARGDGFLYKMVRSLAGFLIRVGAGDLPPESARTILASKLRTATVPTAPPQGLFLWKVFYSDGKK